MDSPAISVIIPVYNTEKYLDKCLSSLANQRFRDFEAIIIDDGSTDGSAEIMRRYAGENPNFICLYKENGGQASARNLALTMARGRYLAFLDSDDSFEPEHLQRLHAALISTGADVSICSFYRIWENTTHKRPLFFRKRPGLYGRDDITRALLGDFLLHSYLWNRLWKREIFDGFTFSDMRYEDLSCIAALSYKADKTVVLPDPLYNYLWREGATSKSINPRNSSDYIRAVLLVRRFLEDNGVFSRFRGSYFLLFARAKFVCAYSALYMRLKHGRRFHMGANHRRAARLLNLAMKPGFPLSREDILAKEIFTFDTKENDK